MTKSNRELIEQERKILSQYDEKDKILYTLIFFASSQLPEIKSCLLEIEQKQKEYPSWELSDVREKFTTLLFETNAEIYAYEMDRKKLSFMMKKQIAKINNLKND